MRLKYRFAILLIISLALAMSGANRVQQKHITIEPGLLKQLKYRFIGPMRGGRVTAVTGVPQHPRTFYMGTTGGGVWCTRDGGISWENISDGFFKVGSIGSVEVAQSNPNIIYVGTGSASPRGNISSGRGIYKSTDRGKSWKLMGLERGGQIGKLQIHPHHPQSVYAAVLGNIFAPSSERGVFRTRDGGKSWTRVFYIDDKTGCIDLVMDPTNPLILYAGMWRVERKPWTLIDGGKQGGVWKSTDGGDTWKPLKGGLPTGIVGRVGIAVSPVNSEKVWVVQEAEGGKDGGIYLSLDGGKKWKRINKDRRFRQRAWYYSRIFADPIDEHTVYILNTSFYKSLNDGREFQRIPVPHGDNHCLWINPTDNRIMIQSNDGGANVSFNGGKSWSSQTNQPTAEIYRVTVDHQFPYRLYGDQQDNSSLSIASQGRGDFYRVGGGESGHIAVDPRDPSIIYAGNYIGILTRLDRKKGHIKRVDAYPELDDGIAPRDLKYRFQWNFPIRISPHDPGVLYITSNHVHRSTNGGQDWQVISPDLTRNIDRYLGRAGGPVQNDVTGVETYCTIFAFEEAASEAGVLWAGSDDGLVHISRDNGQTWQNVTPRNMPPEGTVNMFDISATRKGQALMAVFKYRDGDTKPYIFRTRNYGVSWQLITSGRNGIPADFFVRAVREDPARPGLLYAGTEFGMFVSFDDGKNWQSLQLNLPVTPVTDMVIHRGDLAISTQGRGFWILDDIGLLHQVKKEHLQKDAVLYQPEDVYRTQVRGTVARLGVYAFLKEKPKKIKLEILDSSGKPIRRFKKLTASKGINRFNWNLTHDAPERIKKAVVSLSYLGGAKAIPGTYQVRLTVNKTPLTQTFRIIKDPRWAHVSQQDLEEQLKLQLETGRLFTSSHNLIKKIRSIQQQVTAITKLAQKASYGKALKEISDRLLKKIRKLENVMIQTKNESGQDPINFQVKLDNQLAYLYSMVYSQDSKPVASIYTRRNELKGQLDKAVLLFKDLQAKELKAFISFLEEKKIPRIIY